MVSSSWGWARQTATTGLSGLQAAATSQAEKTDSEKPPKDIVSAVQGGTNRFRLTSLCFGGDSLMV